MELNERQEQIKNKLGVRKTIKLMKLMNTIRNSICSACRTRFDLNKGQLDLKEYCNQCKPKVEPKLKHIERMCK